MSDCEADTGARVIVMTSRGSPPAGVRKLSVHRVGKFDYSVADMEERRRVFNGLSELVDLGYI